MESLAQFRAERLAALTAPDGWLNLIDRIETAPGSWTLGRAEGNDLRLSAGPDYLGHLTVTPDNKAVLTDPSGQEHPFQPRPEAPAGLAVANLLLELHIVEGHPALRVRQVDHPARLSFAGLRHFPESPAWVIRAAWEVLDEPEALAIAMKGGAADTVTISHRARFTHEGREVVLTPTHRKGGKPMFVIRDATAGKDTYGAARFLLGEDRTEDEITLDFNRAINPPCAFTDLAICPLPPPGNVMPFRIEAGERWP